MSGEALAVREQGVQQLNQLESLMRLGAQIEAAVVRTTRELASIQGKLWLAQKHVSSPDELTNSQRARWRSSVKSLTRHEVQAATGWGAGEVMDLVALATSPRAVLDPVCTSLDRGLSSWKLARRYHRKASSLETQHAASLAHALFGQDSEYVVPERLGADGRLLFEPWHHSAFNRALDREVTKIKARDETEREKERSRVRQAGNLWATIHEDGTAVLSIQCTATQAAAIKDRLYTSSRRARRSGDPRGVRQIQSALAVSLLLHSDLDLPALPQNPDLITPAQTAATIAILKGMPKAVVNVIVGLDTLLTPAHTQLTPAHTQSAGPFRDAHSCDNTSCSGHCTDHPVSSTHQTSSQGVAEVIGSLPHFLDPSQARELALAPGSTLFRLLTDPSSGRLVERSIQSYPFDRAMKAQILAADVTCRAPGCVVSGSFCQFDHVQEHGTVGGHTRESNGALLHEAHHHIKTEKFWDSVMDENRTMTWTSLLGKIYETRPHDYRQYRDDLGSETTTIPLPPDDTLQQHLQQLRELEPSVRASAIDRAIYEALTYRAPGDRLAAPDDYPDELDPFGWDGIVTTHIDQHGRRAYGKPVGNTTRDSGPDGPDSTRHRGDETSALPPPPPF